MTAKFVPDDGHSAQAKYIDHIRHCARCRGSLSMTSRNTAPCEIGVGLAREALKEMRSDG